MSKRILVEIDKADWEAILSAACGDNSLEEETGVDYNTIRITEKKPDVNDSPVECESCGLTIAPGDGVAAECGDGWFHRDPISADYESCYEGHMQNCSLCPIDI